MLLSSTVQLFTATNRPIRGSVAAICLLLVSACGGSGVRAAGHSLLPEKSDEPSEKPATTEQIVEAPGQEPEEPVKGPIAEPPRLLYAEVPEDGSLIGKPGGIAIEAFSPSGHWVAFCQGEEGKPVSTTARGEPTSEVSLHLHLSSGEEGIDALLAYDPSGRFLVVQKGDAPYLIDALTQEQHDLSPLSPDLRSDRLPTHRSFAFVRSGLVLLSADEGKKPTSSRGYFLPLPSSSAPRNSAAAESTVVETAVPIHFGERSVWRLSGSSEAVAATTVKRGARWPVSESTAPRLRCATPHHSFEAYERLSSFRPDKELETSWLRLPSSGLKTSLSGSNPAGTQAAQLHANPAPGYVFSFQEGWVRREDSGRLLLVSGRTQKQIASERCGARILHADEKSGLFLAACEEYSPKPPKKSRRKKKPRYRFDLYLLRPGFVRALRADVARTGVDVHGELRPQLIPIRPGAHASLVDPERRAITHLDPGIDVLTSSSTLALLRKGNSLSLWSYAGETDVEMDLEGLTPVVTSGASVAIGSTLFTLREELTRRSLPSPPLSISSQGYALIPRSEGSEKQWPQGPLLLLGSPEEDAPLKSESAAAP